MRSAWGPDFQQAHQALAQLRHRLFDRSGDQVLVGAEVVRRQARWLTPAALAASFSHMPRAPSRTRARPPQGSPAAPPRGCGARVWRRIGVGSFRTVWTGWQALTLAAFGHMGHAPLPPAIDKRANSPIVSPDNRGPGGNHGRSAAAGPKDELEAATIAMSNSVRRACGTGVRAGIALALNPDDTQQVFYLASPWIGRLCRSRAAPVRAYPSGSELLERRPGSTQRHVEFAALRALPGHDTRRRVRAYAAAKQARARPSS